MRMVMPDGQEICTSASPETDETQVDCVIDMKPVVGFGFDIDRVVLEGPIFLRFQYLIPS